MKARCSPTSDGRATSGDGATSAVTGSGYDGLNWNGHILMDERDAIREEMRKA